MHLLEKRLDDFLVGAFVVLYLFIQLFANVVVFGVHALLGLPPGVRVHPVLDDPRLIARRQVNELVDVFVHVVLDPLVVLHVHGLAFQVRAMNGPLVHVHALQIVNNDGADALHDAVRFGEFQILERDFQSFHEIAQVDGVLAVRVQKQLQVELRVVGDVVRVVGDAIAKTRSRQSERQRAVVGHLRLNRVHQHLVLVDHVLVLRHHFLVVRHQILHHFNQIRKLLVLGLRLRLRLRLRLQRMRALVNAQPRTKFIRFSTHVASMNDAIWDDGLSLSLSLSLSSNFIFVFCSVDVSVVITFVSTCNVTHCTMKIH